MKTTLLFFSLLMLPFLAFAENVEDYICDKDVVILPVEVTVKTPRLTYVGKYTDGRPVFYQADSNVIYVYDKNFQDSGGSKMPQMFEWSAGNELRVTSSCITGINDQGGNTCNYNHFKTQGLKSYFKSLHVSCGQTDLDATSLNKDFIKSPVVGCLSHNNELGLGVKRCCDKLELNPNTKKCDEPVLVDPNLTACENHRQCTDKKGCYPQREGDMFQADGLEMLSNIVSGQMDQWDEQHDMKKNGDSCSHARECSSYSCYGGICENKQVCRFADKGELAPTGINCKEGYEKDQFSKCAEGDAYTPFVGMLDSIKFELEGQCGFTIDKDQKMIIEKAMKSVRAMEWLTTKLSENGSEDCFKMTSWLRDKIGLEMMKARQVIIDNFSKEILLIEQDFETLKRARTDNSTQTSMHGMTITEADIASRQSGGWDSLMLMYRRNALFQSYEIAMRDLTRKTADLMVNMAIATEKWADNSKGPWDFGDGTQVPIFDCTARYEKYNFWRFVWKTHRYDETKNRWMTYYDVKMSVPDNKEIIDRPKVQETLGTVHQKDLSVIAQMYSGDHGLLDPLNLGAKAPEMHFESFGSKINRNIEQPKWQQDIGDTGTTVFRSAIGFSTVGFSEVFDFFNSAREVRYARKLDGTSNGTYKLLHASFKPSILEYYKSLRTNNQVSNFVYEPELNNPNMKDCVDKVDSAECAGFKAVMEELNDIAFGQFLAYSYKTSDSYKNYFRNPDAGRNLLFHRFATDLHNLNFYYSDIVGKRETQNKCIETLIGNIEANFDGGSGGINFYGGNYDNESTGAQDGKGVKHKASKGKSDSSYLNRFHINLLTGKPMEYKNGTYDGVDTSLAGGEGFANSGSLAAGALAVRRAKMNAANTRALKNGIDLAKKEAALKNAIGLKPGEAKLAAVGLSHGGGQDGKQGETGASHKAGLDTDASASNEKLDSANEAGSGSNGSMSTGRYSDVSASGGDSKGRDGTGMSDEEKSNMLSNLERTKGQYIRDDYDGLFKIVSKAYVRNLEKILTRKKESSEGPK